jgi:hypothetical protein
MSRWSSEEDKYILEFIQEVQDEINYQELVASHNKSFNTKRTEDTYKVRVRKVAKDNNIILKTNNRWTEDEKDKLVKAVNSNPLNINWTEMASQFNRTEISVRNMYNDLVSPESHIECCMNAVSESEIKNIMNILEKKCNKCNKSLYSINPMIWDKNIYCEECHYNMHNNEIINRWKLISEYSSKTGKDSCNICKKKYDCTKQICKFNFDHKNMFEKSDSVYSMIRSGINLDDIYKEIDLCQLLCVSCHNIITSIEQKTGFNRIKINMTKEYNKTNDLEQKDKIMKQYSEIYEKYMNNIYKMVKNLV